jgi:hypothetical protein
MDRLGPAPVLGANVGTGRQQLSGNRFVVSGGSGVQRGVARI